MLVWVGQDTELADNIKIVNYIFLGIFTLEAILKLIVLRSRYFLSSWNVFDFVVVIISIATSILQQLNLLGNIGSTTTIVRMFRIMRVLRLIRKAKTLRILFATFIYALPSLANIVALLTLLLFMFTILGMEFFAYTKWQTGGLNQSYNFMTFT